MSQFSIKHALGTFVSTLVLMLPLPAIADDIWRFEEQFEGRENVSHQEIVDNVYERTTPPDGQTIGSNLREIFEAIFEPTAVKIPMRVFAEDGTLIRASTIYYSEGELFSRSEPIESGAEPFGGEDNETNFATIDGSLYAWESNESVGKELTRFTGDTVSLVIYLTDWSIAMRSTYFHYLREPENFIATEDNGVTTLTFNDADTDTSSDFFEGMRFSSDPLWMDALILNIPDCKRELAPLENCSEADRTTQEITMEVGYPIPIEEIPADVKTLPEGVTFEPSPWTASSYMGYL